MNKEKKSPPWGLITAATLAVPAVAIPAAIAARRFSAAKSMRKPVEKIISSFDSEKRHVEFNRSRLAGHYATMINMPQEKREAFQALFASPHGDTSYLTYGDMGYDKMVGGDPTNEIARHYGVAPMSETRLRRHVKKDIATNHAREILGVLKQRHPEHSEIIDIMSEVGPAYY